MPVTRKAGIHYPPDDIFEEAAIWHMRLRDARAEGEPVRLAELQKELDAWLGAAPTHVHAYAQAQSLWEDLAGPTQATMLDEGARDTEFPFSVPLPRPVRPLRVVGRTARRGRLLPILAGALGIAMFAIVLWQQDIVTRLQSDYIAGTADRPSITLADDSRITLNAGSALATDFTPGERRVRLLRGEAWFDVSSTDSRPFLVDTPNGTVRVTGTQFNVRIGHDDTVVSLVEGEVELYWPQNAGDAPVMLSPGMEATLASRHVPRPHRFDETAVTAWRRGQLVFYDMPLGDVVAALNRYRSGEIVILNPDLKQLRVNGVFRTTAPDSALQMIVDTLPVTAIRMTDYLILLH